MIILLIVAIILMFIIDGMLGFLIFASICNFIDERKFLLPDAMPLLVIGFLFTSFALFFCISNWGLLTSV